MAEIDPDDVHDVSDLSKGDRVEGRVQSVTSFGAFVRVGQVTGLLHISNMSRGYVDDPGDIVSVGDTVEVVVLDVDKNNRRVSFGLKQLEDGDEEEDEYEDWEEEDENDVSELTEGEIVTGRVENVTDFGAFIRVGNATGLLHIANMSWEYVNDIKDICQEGDEITVKVLNVDREKHRAEFGLKQLQKKPDRDLASAIDESALNVTAPGTAIQRHAFTGDIYLRLGRPWVANDDTEERITQFVERCAAAHAGSFRVDKDGNIYEQVRSVLFPEGISHAYFVSNASTRQPRNCRELRCPLNQIKDCVLARQCCSVVVLRPACDTPRMEEMFPGDGVLGIRAAVLQCPHKDNGAVLAVLGLSWMPKCEPRPFEIQLSGRMIWSSTSNADRRPGNVFNAKLIDYLSPISLITQRNLTTWREYLQWRNHLLTVKKNGIRYIARRFDLKGRVVIFTVVGPAKVPHFWTRDEIFASPMKISTDKWAYREEQSEDAWKRRPSSIAVGDFDKEIRLGDFDKARLVKDGCPWNDPYVAELSFFLDEDLIEEIGNEFGADVPEDTIVKFIEENFVLPETGFLSVSSIGDESLIRRQQRALDDFAENGSSAAPFLTSYLFDIKGARVPTDVPRIEDFLNKGLNEAQKRAVETMVSAPDVALIQGPPGTGKTTVIAEAIWQFVKQRKRVLLVSQSGAAVDNALDRLENTPEIRAVRLKKDNSYSRREDEGGRYDKNSVLANFYDALAKNAKEQLVAWDSAEERIGMLGQARTSISNFLDRLNREGAILAELREEGGKLQREFDSAQQDLEKRRNIAHNQRLLSDFIAYLNGGEFPVPLSTNGGDSVKEIVSGFEKLLLPVLESFESLGIRLFSPAYQRTWPDDQKVLAVRNSLEQLRVLRADVLPVCKSDIERLKGLVGESVLSDVAALEIDQLQREKQKIEQLEETEEDDDKLNELARRRRDINRKISSLKKDTGFSWEKYRRVFNKPDEESRDVVSWLMDSSHGRTELLSFLEGLYSRTSQALEGVESAKQRFVEQLSESATPKDDIAAAESAVTGIKRQMEANERKVAEVNARCEPVREGLSREVNALSLRVGEKFTDGNAASEWCKGESARLEAFLAETASERRWRQPLLREWVERLESVSQSDESLVLDDYLKSCSVVGMTCTSDNRLLEDGGYDHFDVVIIDEVSKATPPEMLMSMIKAEKTILVGDHRQLPPLFGDREPTAMEEIVQQEEESNVPQELRINRESFRKYQNMVEASLFKQHFEQADDRLKAMLWYQYRMHPDIMRLVNVFYENRLECGIEDPDVARDHFLSGGRVPWMRTSGHAFWIDSSTDPEGKWFEEIQQGTSKENPLEVKLMFKALVDLDAGLEEYAKTLPPDLAKKVVKTVGIISFYGRQKGAIVRESKKYRFKRLKCRIDTVDRFQGQERDYVLVSLTRNKHQQHTNNGRASNAYVAKFERINVAFSRARELLLIFGARDMFVDYKVNLPPLDRSGKPVADQVYRKMIDLLHREGRLLQSRDLLSVDEWRRISPSIVRPQLGDIHWGNRTLRGGWTRNNGDRGHFKGKGNGRRPRR